MSMREFYKSLLSPKNLKVIIVSASLLFRVNSSLQQEIKKSLFQLRAPKINLDILDSKENLDASITLTAVHHGLFLEGDEKDDFVLKWEPKIDCTLRYSRTPGSRILANYPNAFKEKGKGQLTLNPAKEGLRTGIYYCLLVSDADPTKTSVEFKVIVQADAVPIAISPIGKIDLRQGPPLFQWDPVEGVPYYFLFLSEGPLSIDRNEEGEVVGLTGLNLTWQVMTPDKFINFGELDPTGTFINIHVPPLFPGIEYNWIVLNSYGPGPDLISGEVAPVAPSFFEVTRPTLSQEPALIQPAPDEKITSDEIVFQWNPVAGASRYRLFLYEGREYANSDIDYTMWSQITSDTQIRLQAKGFLVKTRYHWRVVAESKDGLSTSEFRRFDYDGAAGWVKFTVTSAENLLSRVEIKVKNEAGGENLVPFVTDTLGIAKQSLPVGDYRFTASRPGFLTTPQQPFTVPNNDTVFINVLLQRSATTVSGQIVDDSGAGIFNATVELKSGNLFEKKKTDADGYFSFSVSPGNWSLRAYKLGFEISDFQSISLSEGEARQMVPVVLQKATNVVSGAVIFAEDSRPVQGTVVRALKDDIVFETTTGNQGGFRFVLGSGKWQIQLQSQGFVASPPSYRFDLTQNQQISAPFQLFSGSLVYGKITFQQRGLSDAQVQAFRKNTGEFVQGTTSNIQGFYALGLQEGEYRLKASKKNFLESSKAITLTQGQTLVEDFSLIEAGFVQGRVIDLETFAPVAGAVVFTLEDTTRRTTSDANGGYILSLPPGVTFQIDAFLPGFGSTGPFPVTTNSGDTVTQDIFLKALSGIIQGRVTDGFRPIKEALVEVEGEGLQKFTDPDGRFEFEIAPGSYNLLVSKECHFSKKVPVNLLAGEIKQINIILEALKSVVTGKVTDTRDDPIADAEVTAMGDTVFSTFTDFTGHYELCLNGGIFRIEAKHLGFFPEDTTLVISEGDSIGNLNFRLRDNFARLSGTVLDTSGIPMAAAFVTLTNNHQSLRATTDSNGSYVIDKIYPGSSQIQAAKEGFYGKKKTLFFQGQEQQTLNLTLYPADGFISGTVRDSQDSTGIPEVSVSAEFSESPGEFFKTKTNISGNYSVSNLPVVPGAKYQVFAFKEGFFSPAPITNVLPKSRGIDFYLVSKSGSISGTVRDRDTAEPLANAKLEATNRRGGRSSAISDSLGEFRLTGLVPTEMYNIAVTLSGFFPEVIENVAPGDTALAVTLLRRYAFVKGRVVDFSTGEALQDIKMEAAPNGSEGRPSFTFTNESGNYMLQLVAGDYTVKPVKLLHRSDPSFVPLRVSPGDTVANVDFTLEAQRVQSIVIQRADQTTQPTISNLEMHCYEATARDVQNRPVNIGKPIWRVNVSNKAATIDSLGCLVLNPDFFGDLTITARDPNSQVVGELFVQVFAPIDSATETVLFDDRGLQMEIAKNTVLSRKEMLVTRQTLAPAKRGRAEYLTTDFSYILKPAGLVFNTPVKLRLPPPPNTQGQATFIAKWDGIKSKWELLDTKQKSENFIEATIFDTGEYVSLAISKALAIENISLIPNPFSPFQEIEGRPGLKIEFDISSSAAPNPLFTVKIYNLEGNLVRILHEQTPFPRGHSIIHWDGKTDNGDLARNGRYLVQFIVEDPAEKRDAMRSVVLIK